MSMTICMPIHVVAIGGYAYRSFSLGTMNLAQFPFLNFEEETKSDFFLRKKLHGAQEVDDSPSHGEISSMVPLSKHPPSKERRGEWAKQHNPMPTFQEDVYNKMFSHDNFMPLPLTFVYHFSSKKAKGLDLLPLVKLIFTPRCGTCIVNHGLRSEMEILNWNLKGIPSSPTLTS